MERTWLTYGYAADGLPTFHCSKTLYPILVMVYGFWHTWNASRLPPASNCQKLSTSTPWIWNLIGFERFRETKKHANANVSNSITIQFMCNIYISEINIQPGFRRRWMRIYFRNGGRLKWVNYKCQSILFPTAILLEFCPSFNLYKN